jgi:c-di-GMP-related signal transduction protein
MENYIARQPVFNRRKEVFGYKLMLCKNLRDRYYGQLGKPEDAEELYRQLCFAGFNETPDQPSAFLEFFDELLGSKMPLLPRQHVIVECDDSELADIGRIENIKAQGYRLALDASENISQERVELSDIVKIDFSALSLEAQLDRMENILISHFNRIENVAVRVKFLAYNVETWEDFEKAHAIGYDYFQGNFYLKPQPGKIGDMRSFNTTILRVIAELGQPEPRFKEISSIIEHDLNLSYGLLKLVNSAYFATKNKVKTIAHAVTALGLNELNMFMSAMIVKEAQSPENTELIRCSLIRGKLMELLAAQKNIQQKGAEAFFTGMFSLIDVILNKKMEDVISELPLTDTVKAALTGVDNNLKKLQDMIRDYEQAAWDTFSSTYNLDAAGQENLMNLYLTALKWAESLDY